MLGLFEAMLNRALISVGMKGGCKRHFVASGVNVVWCAELPLDNTPHACRYLVVLTNSIQKVICNFKHFAEEHATDSDTIKAAYAAASTAALQCQPNQPFIIAAAEPPQLKRGRY